MILKSLKRKGLHTNLVKKRLGKGTGERKLDNFNNCTYL
jgi:hypothetical protein